MMSVQSKNTTEEGGYGAGGGFYTLMSVRSKNISDEGGYGAAGGFCTLIFWARGETNTSESSLRTDITETGRLVFVASMTGFYELNPFELDLPGRQPQHCGDTLDP